MIKLMKISKIKNIEPILKDVSFEAKSGEVVTLCGPSGAGKTTTLRIIAGLERITKGSGYIGNRDLTKFPIDRRKASSQVGMVFQNINLYPHLSVMENVSLAPKVVRKLSWNQAIAISSKYLTSLDVYNKKDKFPEELSGGEQQRVALARALALEPQILLLDEPTSALDVEIINIIIEIINEYKNKNRTVVLVTHNIFFAEVVSDKIIFMKNGKTVEIGKPSEIIYKPKTQDVDDFMKAARFMINEKIE